MRKSERKGLSKPEPNPQRNSGKPIWDLVITDMRERDRSGRAKYGTPLQANNGRDALVDAYQEALDLAVYLRQAIEERASAVLFPRSGRAEQMFDEAKFWRLITADISDRRGLKWEWQKIDPAVMRDEVRPAWIKIVKRCLRGAK